MKLVADNVDTYHSQCYKHPVSAIKVLKSECAQIEARFNKEINGLEKENILAFILYLRFKIPDA